MIVAGTLEIAGTLTVDDLTCTTGTLMVDPSATINCETITLDNQNLNVVSAWFLNVSTTAAITNCQVSDSNASGGIEIDGTTDTDNGNNIHWLFTNEENTTCWSTITTIEPLWNATTSIAPLWTATIEIGC